MTIRLFVIALSLLLLPPQLADAQALTAKELKKVIRQAHKAYAAGQGDRAVELYERVLASTQPGDARRADALYAVAMARLSPEGPPRDLAVARRHLGELATSFPQHPRRWEIAAVRQMLGEIEASRAEISRHDADLDERMAALEAERQAIESQREEMAGETEAVGGEVKSLRAQLRKMRAELAETTSLLEEKEAALQKLKDALVSRAGGG